ncbi:hypothetical protein CERSUDRAFT_83128 [Gelatoporia subvermispora B]|uniref:Uncharacterized protein n=1 Tax=Ceriporiopsis subvermispora (strain B) TaxID=914234 RepID=M2QYX8_CERS8|nr:hypothetical protein CERSUDRAFT_83128 [Gelatoporia subvermispora B]
MIVDSDPTYPTMTPSQTHDINDRPVVAQQPVTDQPPPSYEQAVDAGKGPYSANTLQDAKDPYGKIPPDFPQLQDASAGEPSGSSSPPIPTMPPRMVYNYVNPNTGEHIVSYLAPEHPEMVCLQAGEHVTVTHYGWLGILAAVFWFPWGIGCCLMDRKVRCKRCGRLLDAGICG